MPKHGMEVSGDVGAKSESTESGFFRKKIKAAGRGGSCAKPLTYRKPATANDSGGSSGGHA